LDKNSKMKFLLGILLVALCVFAETPLDMLVNNEPGQRCVKGPCKAQWQAYEKAWNSNDYAAAKTASKAFNDCFVGCRFGNQNRSG
ncbi:hypothetical protein T06_2737, partial [Trichinella sp. T6]